MRPQGERLRDVVLVGGGHTHVQVLRSFAMKPPPAIRLTVVLDTPIAVYSGMVPGFVAGQYASHELEIDVAPLARRARARLILEPATGLDPERRRILLRGRPALPYHLASFDIGSTVAGLDVAGVRQWAIPTRPIQDLVARFDEVLARARSHPASTPFHVVVAGGGAGGIELAFAVVRRLRSLAGVEPRVLLVEAGPRILSRYPESLRRRVHERAERHGITILCQREVREVRQRELFLDDGSEVRHDALFWVTGASGHQLFRRSGLPTDERGFVHTRSTLQLEEYDDVFAVGDCAFLVDHPQTPKAGVYAVRQGPFLIHNLRARLGGASLRPYRPQADFLTLLNLGDGTALGAKWGRSFAGGWVFKLKDWIDRRFMRRFQVLASDGEPRAAFASTQSMGGDEEMLCGGCAAKVARATLERSLARLAIVDSEEHDPDVVLGLEQADDVAAFRTPAGDLVVSSVDGFRAFADDPYLVGEVAAVNATSDLHAKDVPPRYAQALVCIPEGLEEADSEELLFQVLAGCRAGLRRAGVRLLGGHSTTGPELMVGLCIDGVATPEQPPLLVSGLEPDQTLLLTKALGTGVVLHADMGGRVRGPWLEATIASMRQGNLRVGQIVRRAGATGSTDVSGFALAGHLVDMARKSAVAVELDLDSLPALPGALELLARGERSTYHRQNRTTRREMGPLPDDPRSELLFDPQTSGGLLFGVPPASVEQTLEELHAVGATAACAIGRVVADRAGKPLVSVLSRG